MSFRKILLIVFVLFVIAGLILFLSKSTNKISSKIGLVKVSPTPAVNDPMSIDVMRAKNYPGSDITIEETLGDGINYGQYIASYKSDGLKIYALLTVPLGEKPAGGWPVIIFNHGYIPPTQYRTTERYVAYVGAFASDGYIVFKPDYRGNGSSEGQPEGAYYSPAYAVDVLNAISSIKKYKDANVSKIGMWGHSMGGNITLRDLEVSPNIKAAVIWGGVVGSYDDLMNNWQRRVTYQPPPNELALRNRRRADLIAQFGTPKSNPTFWDAIDPTYHLDLITAPVQLHAGLEDEEVPYDFSVKLNDKLKAAGKVSELYTYPGADHNISSPSFEVAMQRSVDFFNKYLKD